jgi:GTPase SAR1 family protein
MSRDGGRNVRPEWVSSLGDRPAERSSRLLIINVVLSVLAAASVGIVGGLTSVFGYKTQNWVLLVGVAAAVIAAGVLTTWVVVLGSRASPRSLRIAILGMPRVGKTTLITACFQEIFSRNVNIRVTMSGRRSFELLNDNISRLAVGQQLKPTSDQDVAAYRFEVPPTGFLGGRYRVELGDFPGSDTEQYIEEYGPWLHGTPFFDWVLTCDAFVFCVNAEPLALSFKEEFEKDQIAADEHYRTTTLAYVEQSSAQVRAAWQNIVASFDSRRIRYLRNARVLLVFTKIDMFFRFEKVELAPLTVHLDVRDVEVAEEWLKDRFKDLNKYLDSETNNFAVAATSCFATSGPSRVGISEFLHGVLPRGVFLS